MLYYCLSLYCLTSILSGYSGAHAATVSSVLVTNLSTGFKKGDWDKVEVLFQSSKFLMTSANFFFFYVNFSAKYFYQKIKWELLV